MSMLPVGEYKSTSDKTAMQPVLSYLQKYYPLTNHNAEMLDTDNTYSIVFLMDDFPYENIKLMCDALSRHDSKLLNDVKNLLQQTESTDLPDYVEKLNVWQTQLSNATKLEEIVAVIKRFSSSSIADRLTYLHDLPIDDPSEKPIDLESLRNFAFFITNIPHLPYPQIDISPDGLVNVEWDIADYCILAMEFMPSDDVRFAVVFRQQELEEQQQYIGGILLPNEMMKIIQPFIHRLMSL